MRRGLLYLHTASDEDVRQPDSAAFHPGVHATFAYRRKVSPGEAISDATRRQALAPVGEAQQALGRRSTERFPKDCTPDLP